MVLQCVRWQPSIGKQKHTFLCSSEPKDCLLQAPVLLRLAFHDAATHEVAAGDGGANASVQYEFSRPENMGLKRGWCGLAEHVNSLVRTVLCMLYLGSYLQTMHLLDSLVIVKDSSPVPALAAGH